MLARVPTIALAAFALVICIPTVVGLIHQISISNDARSAFVLETFGYFAGGTLVINAKDIKINGGQEYKNLGFLVKQTETDSGTFLEDTKGQCENFDQLVDSNLQVQSTKLHATKIIHSAGFYSVIFLNCDPNSLVSFELDLEMFNPGPNYLSAGLTPLPKLYTLIFFVYIGVLVVWLLVFMRGTGKKVYRIHHLMTILIVLKLLSMLFKAIEYHYKQTTGHPGGWAVAYYIFAGLKGIIMFVVIALIGTGWAFIKPYLSEKDKKIFLVVIPLQVLANVVTIILEETAPGSQGWFTWNEIFRLVDIICCAAILVPIIWSIKHLRDAAQIDGKAQRNMEKLKLFRQFYLLVVTYIYFTRIIVYLMDATLPFNLVWLGDFFTEMATLAFWCITGYKFRPVADNPYFSMSDGEGHELDDMGDVEIEMEPPEQPPAGSKALKIN